MTTIKIPFTKKSIRQISASELAPGTKGLELKIQTNFHMFSLVPNLHQAAGSSITDAPFEKISFVFKGDAEKAYYDTLLDSENQNIPKRGEIWLAEFPLIKESRKPTRPCLVISNDLQNEFGKWVVVIALTTKDIKNVEPFEVFVEKTKELRIDKPSKLKFNYL